MGGSRGIFVAARDGGRGNWAHEALGLQVGNEHHDHARQHRGDADGQRQPPRIGGDGGDGDDDADKPHRRSHARLVDGDAHDQVAHHIPVVCPGVALPVQHGAEQQEGHNHADDDREDQVERAHHDQVGQLLGQPVDFGHGQKVEDERHDGDGADDVRPEHQGGIDRPLGSHEPPHAA